MGRINMWELKTSLTPNWVMRDEDISHTAKCCYGMLALYESTYGKCTPFIHSLAKDLGTTEEKVENCIEELIKFDYIDMKKLSKNHYEFFLEPGGIER